ncbi:MAG TPA: YceI family protein [Syntrophobacteria bacterium]|nr:YceI family protein [Syntrophobacteria bacterium]
MGEGKGITTVSHEKLRAWMEAGRDLVIIDTLPGDVYRKRHLPGAKNACVYEVVFLQQAEAIVPDRNREIVVYGSSIVSMDAVTAAEKFARLGYQRVHVLSGGLAAWQQAGYPLEGEELDGTLDPGTHLILPERTYAVDGDQSVVEWTGRNQNNRHFGTVNLAGGEITVQGSEISGSLTIDMRTIKNIDLEGNDWQPVLIAHLESDDFFFVKLFPAARFTITSAELVSDPTLSSPNLEVEGILELRGVRNSLSFPATVNTLADGGIVAEAHFDLDRTRWKVIYGSSRFFEHLGMHLVFDLITIQLRIVAR